MSRKAKTTDILHEVMRILIKHRIPFRKRCHIVFFIRDILDPSMKVRTLEVEIFQNEVRTYTVERREK